MVTVFSCFKWSGYLFLSYSRLHSPVWVVTGKVVTDNHPLKPAIKANYLIGIGDS